MKYLFFTLFSLFFCVAVFEYITRKRDQDECKDCDIELSAVIFGSIFWFITLVARRISVGHSLFLDMKTTKNTFIEGVVGGALWGILNVFTNMIHHLRKRESNVVTSWNGVTFKL